MNQKILMLLVYLNFLLIHQEINEENLKQMETKIPNLNNQRLDIKDLEQYSTPKDNQQKSQQKGRQRAKTVQNYPPNLQQQGGSHMYSPSQQLPSNVILTHSNIPQQHDVYHYQQPQRRLNPEISRRLEELKKQRQTQIAKYSQHPTVYHSRISRSRSPQNQLVIKSHSQHPTPKKDDYKHVQNYQSHVHQQFHHAKPQSHHSSHQQLDKFQELQKQLQHQKQQEITHQQPYTMHKESESAMHVTYCPQSQTLDQTPDFQTNQNLLESIRYVTKCGEEWDKATGRYQQQKQVYEETHCHSEGYHKIEPIEFCGFIVQFGRGPEFDKHHAVHGVDDQCRLI